MSEITFQTLEKPRILCVDDEPANLNLLQRTFRKDYDLYLADDGQAGLNILEKNAVDLIITDQKMPHMTGVEMLSRGKELAPSAVRMILTAYTDVKDIIAAINSGQIYRYILKPWTPDELKVTVAQALEHSRLARENVKLVDQLRKSLQELKNAQDELLHRERLSTLGRMASTVIHDLKLPMSNIRAGAELLSNPSMDIDIRKKFSEIIIKEVDRLVEMTQEILEFSRGETRYRFHEFDFDELFTEIHEQIWREFETNKIKINKDFTKVGMYNGDANRLRRVVLNLLVNSKEAMKNGGELLIKYGLVNGCIELIIEDSGNGIPLEIIDHIFEPFVTHGKHNGTGLGMSIAQRIVHAHKGEIVAENRAEGGARMFISLPMKRND